MLTVASCITLVRLLLSPVVVYFVKQQDWVTASFIFIVAALTDLLDGFVARRFNQQSKVGQLLDPIADKVLIMSTLYSLFFNIDVNHLSEICIFALIGKELIFLVAGAWLKIRYNFFITPSKLSRVVSLAEIALIIFFFTSLILYAKVSQVVTTILLFINVILSLWLVRRYLEKIKNLIEQKL